MAVHQASSSSYSSNYEVFLSFNGKDVRNNFADHLYHALVDAGIRTFRDEDELPKGDEIGPKLLTAIQQSRISIPIFSDNYASSKWCLDELTEIIECRRTINQIVLPIFYKVEPRDVRNQGGLYAKAFEEHQMRFQETTVQVWKNALREAGRLDGWPCKEDTREAELVKTVVKEVWSSLNKRPLNVSDNLVGIQSHIKEMLRLLDVESDDRLVVGIHGLGGIGKTMIAKVVYNTVFDHFQGCSFIENTQKIYKKHGLIHLQNQLILDILKQENQNIGSVDRKFVIQQRFCRKKVLIVLDDVDQNIQAESLVGNRNWFGIGSKIIITTRNKDILRAQGVDKIYEPNFMDLDDSLQLFSHHAFKRDQPVADYQDISKAIVKTTGGLPLALEAIGSSLFLKEKTIWKAMLKKLQKVPHDEVVKRLVISYDELNEEEQQMFLDTACFFIGMNKDIVCHIWDGCGYSSQAGLDAFCARSLVTISEEGVLRMHDQLRDLGRQIVYQESIDEPGKRTRIWSKEEVLEVLDTHMGTTNVKGICCIDFSNISSNQCLMSEGFAAMRKLKLLQVDYARFSGDLFTHSFSELRWLSWKGCVDENAQTNFCPQKLTVLDLSHSEITENWMGWNCIKMAVNLKVLNLTSCCRLSTTPDLTANRHMEVLILKDCSSLVEIDPSIGYLRNLVTLDMSGCIHIMTLPLEIYQLTSLKRLHLKKCKNLNRLPDKLNLLISLTELDLSFCFKLKSLTNLPLRLTSLDVSDCHSIQYISDLPLSLINLSACGCKSMVKISSTSGLRNLERLNLDRCYRLEEIQVSVDDEGLNSLVLLRMVCMFLKLPNLSNSKRLAELLIDFYGHELSEIKGLENCESLETLTFHYSLLTSLPDLSNLNKLQVLTIESFPLLTTISGLNRLESLRDLKIERCGIRRMPDVSNLKNLNVLKIENCWMLTVIDGVDRLEFLKKLEISGCGSLKKLPDLSNLKSSNDLRILGCKKLTEIHGVDRMELLEKLEISECKSLKRLPNLSNLKSLNDLRILGCKKLTEIHGVDRMKFLEKLDITGCQSLERLPDLSNLTKLKQLRAHGCKKLSEIRGVDRLTCLDLVDISGCENLERLPDLSNSKSLNVLKIEGCSRNLTEIHGVDGLEFIEKFFLGQKFIEKLDISWCESLERLPDLSNFNNLKELRANGCRNLTEIHGVDRLEFLESLDISGCESLERLPDLSNLNNLKVLRANITKIHGVDKLEFLESLDISGCESLERLPDLSNLKILKELRANGCKKLTEIHSVDRLEFLESLDISGCESLERLPDLSNLKNLKELRANGCKKLTEIHGVDRLEFLELLDISGCKSLERLLDLSNLKELITNGCKKLIEIHDVDRLEFLKSLDISGCESLERLPDLSTLNNLKVLRANGCKKLTETHGVDRLEFLASLDISGCESLERLPDLSNLKNLKELRANGCKKLTEIHGVDRLEFLESLDVSGCESLERLPDLSNLKNLKELRATHCLVLNEIKAANGLESLERLHIWGCKALKKIPDLTILNNFWDLNRELCWDSTANVSVGRFRVELLDKRLRPCLSNLTHALSHCQRQKLIYQFILFGNLLPIEEENTSAIRITRKESTSEKEMPRSQNQTLNQAGRAVT